MEERGGRVVAARLVRVVAALLQARLLRASAGEVGGGEVAAWRHACALGEREDRRGTGGNVLHWVHPSQCNSLQGGNLLHPMAINCSQCNKLPR